MNDIRRVKKQAILLFVALEEENIKQINNAKTVNCKKQNEVNEFTEIWELVKK